MVKDIESYTDIEKVVIEAVEKISDLLALDINVGGLAHWEFIGHRFNLYSFSLLVEATIVGELRVVETSGYVVNISGVLRDEVKELLGREVAERLLNGKVLGRGTIPSEVYLSPRHHGTTLGQKMVPRLIVYAVEGVQDLDARSWKLIIRRDSEVLLELGYEELAKQSTLVGDLDFHCVTGWSTRLHEIWGASLSELLEEVGARVAAYKWLGIRSNAGYSTIVPLSVALEEGILVTRVDGKPLMREHGFPVRLFFPSLFGWKAAKWVKELVLLHDYEDGFWEARGYHERGLARAEERFKIRNPLLASFGQLPEVSIRKLPPARRD